VAISDAVVGGLRNNGSLDPLDVDELIVDEPIVQSLANFAGVPMPLRQVKFVLIRSFRYRGGLNCLLASKPDPHG
jgi:hypothetical protein